MNISRPWHCTPVGASRYSWSLVIKLALDTMDARAREGPFNSPLCTIQTRAAEFTRCPNRRSTSPLVTQSSTRPISIQCSRGSTGAPNVSFGAIAYLLKHKVYYYLFLIMTLYIPWLRGGACWGARTWHKLTCNHFYSIKCPYNVMYAVL